MTFRGLLMWVHLLLGLTGAIVIAIASLTGVYITFQGPLERWLIPVPAVAASPSAPNLLAIVNGVEAKYAPRRVTGVSFGAGQAAIVRLSDRSIAFVHPVDASVIRFRQASSASLENLTAVVRRLHINLLLGPRGRQIVTLATAEALLLVLTGAWLWWRKKHWQFTVWRGSVFRVSWDLHNATGIWFLLPALSMIVTGLLIAVPAPVFFAAGADSAPFLAAPSSRGIGEPGTPIALSRALAVADSAVPGGAITRLLIPRAAAAAIAIEKDRGTIYVDRTSGQVIEVRAHRVPTAGDRALGSIEALHTGELLGMPGRTVMTLGSLMLAVMTVTGVVLGWKRLLILTRRAPDTP
jgi:uncharacterized iron-regulated membrane protein